MSLRNEILEGFVDADGWSIIVRTALSNSLYFVCESELLPEVHSVDHLNFT